MAKKVSERKAGQGFRNECPRCGNCTKFTSDIFTRESLYGDYQEEKNKRCSIGGFAVGKMNWCPSHEFNK